MIKNCEVDIDYLLYATLDIGVMVRVFANDPADLGSIPGRVKPKTQKILLDAILLKTQYYKVRIKGTIYQPLRSGRIWHKVNF